MSAGQVERLYKDLLSRLGAQSRRTDALQEQLDTETAKTKSLSQELLLMKSEYGDHRWRGLAVPFLGRNTDFDRFILQVEKRFGENNQVFENDQDKCLFALFCFRGVACVLRGMMIRRDLLRSWVEFKRELGLLVEECSEEVVAGLTLLQLRYVCAFSPQRTDPCLV